MRMQLVGLLRRSIKPGLMASALFASSAGLHAQNGTWTSTVDALWSAGGSWSGGTIADGANNTANFNTLDISDQTATTTFPAVGIELDSPRTIGHLIFGDTNAATPGAWDIFTLDQVTNVLTLSDATKPTITVNPLGPVGVPPAQDAARILVNLAGTQGFTKLGTGVLTLQGNNTITGGINVDAGTLRLRTPLTAQAITLGNGATLDTNQTIDTAPASINVPSGATATILAASGIELGNFNASGATVNVRYTGSAVSGAPGTITADGSWAVNGSPARVNVSSDVAGSFFRMRPNGGSPAFNTTASFANTHLDLDNIVAWSRSSGGPGGNTYNIGALSGSSTGVLSGGGQGGGFVAYYVVGSLNTDTEFAGTIDNTSAPYALANAQVAAPPYVNGGLVLTKVGTGTLTLSGTLNYRPTSSLDATRRGGVTTITGGTLKLTNSAAIPGGTTNADPVPHGTTGAAQAFVGTTLSTVNIQAAGTLDVSGYTAGTYSTAPLQQIIGAGNVIGNYAHDEGFIRPGNTLPGTAQNPNPVSTAVAGTLSFANDFTWNGGEVAFDIAPTPVTGNDLISVAGAATITSGVVTPNFPGGIPATGTYTLLSAGSISGSAAGITVEWPGRAANPVPFFDGNSLKVNAPGVSSANLTWVGNNGPNWDVETTGNWAGASPNTFFQADNVTFDDTASSFAVTVVGNVQPSNFVVNNATNAYTISGSGVIGGNANFSKTGAAKLTMTTANTFIGTATITGGTVDIGNTVGALGAGVLTLDNGHVQAATTATAGLTNSRMVIVGNSSIEVNGTPVAPLGLPTMSGSGNLTLFSNTVAQAGSPATSTGKNIDIGTNDTANGGFNGNLNLIGAVDNDGIDPVITVNTTVFRLNGANSSLPNSTVTLTQGASLRDRATGVANITLGALAGDATATLFGFQGGATARQHTWTIGTLNTDTTFAGVVQNSAGSSSSTAPANIVKVGTGELTLSGANTYTGNTTVLGGTLSISSAYLADVADVSVAKNAVFDLNFVGTDIVDSLWLDGFPQAINQTYGAVGSGANVESAFFTGTGLLQVTTLGASPDGDYDNDGDVDGRDFLIWQRGGSPSPRSTADLQAWQTNFGTLVPLTAATSVVPEPTGIVLVGMAGLFLTARRRS